MLQKWTEINSKDTHRVIGLMSGTSADGVNAALCEISGHGGRAGNGLNVKLIAQHAEEYPKHLRDRVLAACNPSGGTSAEICRLNFDLAEVYAKAALGVLASCGAKPADIDLIGCHGQTVWHIPPRQTSHGMESGATLQLGEPAVLAERTGILVVSNFRPRDMAAGGQGAPLVPFVDYLLFSNPNATRVLLNIGGISNVTYLPAGGVPDDTLAYDTGPGNMIVDALVQVMTEGQETYDRDGVIAASGAVQPILLAEMLKHDYLRKPPPKSTGREEFGMDFAMKIHDFGTLKGMYSRDIIATATCFTARAIAESLKDFLLPKGRIDELIVSGGGALNPVMMRHLQQELTPVRVANSDGYGIPIKAKESIAFAILARETALGRPSNLPSATGARGPRVLGQITPA